MKSLTLTLKPDVSKHIAAKENRKIATSAQHITMKDGLRKNAFLVVSAVVSAFVAVAILSEVLSSNLPRYAISHNTSETGDSTHKIPHTSNVIFCFSSNSALFMLSRIDIITKPLYSVISANTANIQYRLFDRAKKHAATTNHSAVNT